jgi:hypothetical protein
VGVGRHRRHDHARGALLVVGVVRTALKMRRRPLRRDRGPHDE